ncbi:MAG: gamma-glutamyltransferase [Planctomycetales bacterium]|nr:gamma-glutamyltransferase [Planctomycetales bacterium]
MSVRIVALLLVCFLWPSDALHAQLQLAASGTDGMIAAVQPLATAAGLNAFEQGGNAVDAAIATAVMLGVVDSHNSGLGGGCFILIRKPDGELLAIDGRETAPQLASRDMFLRDGQAVPELSQHGALAIGVPGAFAAYDKAMSVAGRLSLRTFLENAAVVAEEGYPIDRVMARNLRDNADLIRAQEATRAVLLKSNDSPYTEGEILIQSDLAKTYRRLASDGQAWFYQGEFAEQTDRWMQANGGVLRQKDFAAYQAKLRQPIVTRYRDYQIVGFPPPSSGGVHVAEMLNILEHFDLAQLHQQDPQLVIHVVAEAMKLAFADRAYWLGDADFVGVPKGLVDKRYAARLAQRIDLAKATEVSSHGTPEDWDRNQFGKHTTHIAAADAEGYWVAITATVNTSFGSKVMIPGTGLVLNNEMDDFSAQPGVPNAFGLIGAENNAVAPGKRPLSSMSPTIVLKNGQPVMTLGAAGGPKIITQVLLTIIRHLDLGMPIDQAVAAPRFHHQWKPDRLFIERTWSETAVNSLQRKGHAIEFLDHVGILQAIVRTPEGTFTGVADPRVPGKAAGFTKGKANNKSAN